jgi:hypothetical protein
MIPPAETSPDARDITSDEREACRSAERQAIKQAAYESCKVRVEDSRHQRHGFGLFSVFVLLEMSSAAFKAYIIVGSA